MDLRAVRRRPVDVRAGLGAARQVVGGARGLLGDVPLGTGTVMKMDEDEDGIPLGGVYVGGLLDVRNVRTLESVLASLEESG